MPNISKLGEFGLIDRIRKTFKMDPSVIRGPGDDCAVVAFNKKYYQLLTCDMIAEGVDFTRRDDPLLVARKALAISVSDIAACAGIPRYCLVTLAMPKTTPAKYVDGLIRGMRGFAAEFDINIVGGDLSSAKQIIINTAMCGLVEKNKLVLRNGAKVGDIIFVTGSLGGSIRGRHLSFKPRVEEARYLAAKFRPTAMIDISDGLCQDLGHILKESKVGAVIYEDLIPLNKDARGIEDALYMGEDFELLFTLPLGPARKLEKQKPAFCKPIGEIFHKKCGFKMIDKFNRYKLIRPQGYRHFK
ncbi:MAG: thiamine-phosphate kinase [Candidatus Omnitrophota bacterium]|nr:thiamine-phosphate kinase [Candidatus Omnitrophota bacterium]